LDDRRGCAAARADQPVAKAHCDDGRTFDAIRRDELELTARTPSGQAC
jgi:hypothetical protein